MIAALQQGVPQYRGLKISIERVQTEKVMPLSCYMESFKLARVAELEKILSDVGLENAARLQGSPWPITPPVIEQLRDGSLIVIDGTHRIYHALRNGQQQIRVILVENSERSLPAKPLDSWNRVQIMPMPVRRDQRYRNYNEGEFRPIRNAFSIIALRGPTVESPTRQPVAEQSPMAWASTEHESTLERPRVPFRGHQMADFFLQEVAPRCRGFRLHITIPAESYWRAGFALSPDDYIREGRSDIEITQFFLFHLGRGHGADPYEYGATLSRVLQYSASDAIRPFRQCIRSGGVRRRDR